MNYNATFHSAEIVFWLVKVLGFTLHNSCGNSLQVATNLKSMAMIVSLIAVGIHVFLCKSVSNHPICSHNLFMLIYDNVLLNL